MQTTSTTLQAAVRRFGTPLYVYDAGILAGTAAALRGALGPGRGLCFAMKANPRLAGLMAGLCDRVELCSPGELRAALSQGVPPEKCFVSGVLKRREELEFAVDTLGGAAGYTVESPGQLELFAELGKKRPAGGEPLKLWLRLTGGNQFGMDGETWFSCARRIASEPGLALQGLHFFTGTQKREKDIRKDIGTLNAFLREAEVRGVDIPELEYGPGLAAEYFVPRQGEPSPTALTRGNLDALADALRGLEFGGKLTVELGRALCADAGTYITRIEEIKPGAELPWLITDGGIHQLHYDGQIRGMYTPFVTLLPREGAPAPAEDAPRQGFRVCGALCSAADILCAALPLPPCAPGDCLAFARAGAYSAAEGPALLLTRELPGACLYSEAEGLRLLSPRRELWPLFAATED